MSAVIFCQRKTKFRIISTHNEPRHGSFVMHRDLLHIRGKAGHACCTVLKFK